MTYFDIKFLDVGVHGLDSTIKSMDDVAYVIYCSIDTGKYELKCQKYEVSRSNRTCNRKSDIGNEFEKIHISI